MPASRSVVSMLLRELGDFLYTLKAGPAGGRLRRPSSAGASSARARLYGPVEYIHKGEPV
jgi:hypothetical protein